MTFLQPFILWGLPLALLPLLIHLLNRMRYRTQRWAAMSFLFSANRASTRYAKLRQFLILACRVLALLALIAAIARPLAGGWIGWALSPTPEVILVLLDRSASMEAREARSSLTRRELALRAIANAAGPYAERSRFVLMENALRQPQEIAKPDLQTLSRLALTGGTDTAADLPAMLDAAAEWLARSQTGLTEIWIASDLQRSNWQPQSSRWPAVAARLAALRQTVRVRLLALAAPPSPNTSLAITDLNRRERAGQPQLDLTLALERADTAPASLPVSITLDDSRSQFDATMTGQSLRLHRALTLDPLHPTGWGKIELPADGNARDNAAYFIYGPPLRLRVALLADDEASRRFLSLAAAPPRQSGEIITGDGSGTDWDPYALVVWQSALPAGKTAQALQTFVERGGVVIFFAPGAPGTSSFAGTSWGPVETAEPEQAFRVGHWDEQEGPLARSDEGLSLPVSSLSVPRRQSIIGGGDPRASFGDGPPFLTERAVGHGRILFCATLPHPEWSNLNSGQVLVPMLQRLRESGGRRFAAASSLTAGDPALVENPARWSSVDAPRKEVRWEAGIYRNGAALIAVNRPASEDVLETIEPTAVKALFGSVPVQLIAERSSEAGPLQGEIWRALLITMLLALLVEGFLSLPLQSARPPQSAPPRARVAEAETVAS
ncbi:MAG: hypothetical protein QOE70_6794 [Chthoniobacter sp.]|jgi:hypothetical protein|nr:hypothetical protein [Chthoniobacter sp.]